MQDGHDTKIVDKGYTRYLQATRYVQARVQAMIQAMYKQCTSNNIQEHQGNIGKEWMDYGKWAGG